jgi:hypothetical protein
MSARLGRKGMGLPSEANGVPLKIVEGWGWSLVVEGLPSTCEALGLIPSTTHMREDC